MKQIPLHLPLILASIFALVLSNCQSNPNPSKMDDKKPNNTFSTSEIEKLFDLSLTESERDTMQPDLQEQMEAYQALHKYSIGNEVPPALQFNPIPLGFKISNQQEAINWNLPQTVELPQNREELAFYPVHKLAVLIKNQQITSTELTKLYLERLKKYGDTLQCVITLTEDLALKQAQKADEEIKSGKYRGSLHGIPYGAKDLLAVEGYKTTWGAMPYKEQQINQTATTVQRLEEAGAVLVAKLTLGALAWGDVWYGGTTKNPWNLEQGSSGSSAGSASATAAGLVAFAIGSETYGSIVSPSTRCRVSGLRPTYGRVSRYGAMALSWSMDKIGPICRNAKDCALVFEAIRGLDEKDPTLYEADFNYNANVDLSKLKVGYFKNLFEADYSNKENDQQSLEVLRKLGANLEEVEMPNQFPSEAFSLILISEAAAAFDELTRSNEDDLLVRQIRYAWPNAFRAARFIPAVEYIQANRVRYQLIQDLHQRFKEFDVIVSPSFGGSQLFYTNLSGHPCVVVPNGEDKEGNSSSLTFVGNYFDEATILGVAERYQEATEFDEMKPPME